MKILVTGGAGYIGSHTVRVLCNFGHEVLVLDNLSAGHRAAVDSRAQFIKGDILDEAALTKTLGQGVEAVVHFAASLSVAESVSNPLKYWTNNVAGTVVLLTAMQRCGVRRMVFSSTAATYGVPEVERILEDTPQRPINPYGASKLAMERAIEDCVRAHQFAAISLRYFNAAGCALDGSLGEDHRPEEHLIPVVLEAALGKRPQIKIFGVDFPTPDGSCVRDFIHVDDLAEAHRVALDAAKPGVYRAYNVGTGKGYSVKQVIETARRVTGRPIAEVITDRRAGDPPTLVADPGRLMKELLWSPRASALDTVVESAWRWLREHPQGYPE